MPRPSRVRFDRSSRSRRNRRQIALSSAEVLESRQLLSAADSYSLVADLYSGLTPDGSHPEHFAQVGATTYFVARTLAEGDRLWKSDGTAAGTVPVSDLFAGVPGSSPSLSVAGNQLWMTANDGINGERLWQTDGTTAGTRLVPDAAGQPAAVDPGGVVEVAGAYYVSAISSEHGRELFTISGGMATPVVSVPAWTLSQRPVITWNAIPGAASYTVWIRNVSTGTDRFLVTSVTTTSLTPTTDLGIGVFRVWVQAVGSAGAESAWSTERTFRVATPVNVTAPTGSQNTYRPVISWQALPGAVRYDVWADNLSTGQSEVIRNTAVTATSFTPASDLPLGRYRVSVRGIDAAGTAAQWSAADDFQIRRAPTVTAPLTPTFDRTPTFQWNPVVGAVRYELYVQRLADGGVHLYEKGLNATSFTPSVDLPVGAYRWWALAVSAQNVRSEWSSPIEFQVGGRPTLLTPVGSGGDTTPEFTWTPVAGAASYNLWVDRADVYVRGFVNLTGLTAAAWTPSSPMPTGTYRAWVQAVSSTGALSAWSVITVFTIAATPESPESPASSAAETAPMLLDALEPQVVRRDLSRRSLNGRQHAAAVAWPVVEPADSAVVAEHAEARPTAAMTFGESLSELDWVRTSRPREAGLADSAVAAVTAAMREVRS